MAAVKGMLLAIGEDPSREGLLDTPRRVAKAYREIFAGYRQDPTEILSTTFACEKPGTVILRGIEFYSMCEHHMLPFFGHVDIEYQPRGRVVGLSKLPRLVECFARRLQLQEQLTQQIATAIHENLACEYVRVTITARHLCMQMRGVRSQNSTTQTVFDTREMVERSNLP
ncbi:MAG: GTP cyclohydrolase I FolE [Oscillospiraceae bacterium]|nr:GTP cyclohydrolase I FolE [Oscillospiraceae bacterium]